jgi:hypothetical protein
MAGRDHALREPDVYRCRRVFADTSKNSYQECGIISIILPFVSLWPIQEARATSVVEMKIIRIPSSENLDEDA